MSLIDFGPNSCKTKETVVWREGSNKGRFTLAAGDDVTRPEDLPRTAAEQEACQQKHTQSSAQAELPAKARGSNQENTLQAVVLVVCEGVVHVGGVCDGNTKEFLV